MKKQLLYLLFSITLLFNAVIAEDSKADLSPGDSIATKKTLRFAGFPIVMRTEASGFGLGTVGMYFLPFKDTISHKSYLQCAGIYTTKHQWGAAFAPDIWINKNTYHFKGDFFYQYWPSEYFGIGNNSSKEFDDILGTFMSAMLGIERGWLGKYYLGGEYGVTFSDITYPDTGIISTNKPTGYRGGRTSEIALNFIYDTRDHAQFPTRGFYIKYKLGMGNSFFTSDYDYFLQNFTVSTYFPTGPFSTLAFSVQGINTIGEVPFYLLPSPNGEVILRGIQEGRYRDKNLLAVLSEYRFPMYKIIDGSVFAEMAQLAHHISSFNILESKFSIGFGIHIAVVPEEKLHMRFDISYVDGGAGFIIALSEAF